MSEQIDNSTFTSEGYSGQASLYGEEAMLHQYASFTTENLELRAERFASMVNNPNTLPTHKAIADRFLGHIAFELGYRDGQPL